AAGNSIQFVEKFDGVSFRHAFEILSDGKAFIPPSDQPLKRATVRRLENPFQAEVKDPELFSQVVDFYHERLTNTEAPKKYLQKRGLYHEEAIEHFKLGYGDRTLGLRLPERNRKEGKAIRERLIKLGLIRQTGHEHFNGSVVLPVFDAEGNVLEMYGRKITTSLRKGTPLHLYLPGPHAGIWNYSALDNPELILCEAPLDALTFWIHGFKNVTFIYGTEGFPKYLFDAMLEHKIQRVRLAYDADRAGDQAAKRDADRLQQHGIECFRIRFPHGMDANEYALAVTPAPKSLDVLVKSAQWLGNGKSHTHAPARIINNKIAAKELAASNSYPVNPVDPVKNSFSKLTRQGEYHIMKLGSRQYRIGGLDKNSSLEVLKITLRLTVEGQGSVLFHLDSIDMTRDNERRRFIERASEETLLEKELIKRDLGKLLLALEESQHQRLNAALEPDDKEMPAMNPEEKAEAISFLKSPDLIKRIEESFKTCGLVGEQNNRLAAYLACTSRKLEKPLAIIIQSNTAAGKTALMEAVLKMFPEEESVKYSAMTGQSLYYLGETDLKHKILAIVEEEGAEKAGYALKLLQSEGELTIASTGKDPHTGRMETQEYHVEGPVMIMLTTTAVEIDEELQNRCLTLAVDESKEQTERIHALQRKARTLEGLRLKKSKQRTQNVLSNAQRLLRPIDVVNPYADKLTFTAERTRTRRDHEKYLTLIDAIALLHQHQRHIHKEGENEYITVTLEDIALANKLAPELLGKSLDELPPQTRRLFESVKTIVRERMKAEELEQSLAFFSRREVRQKLGWSVTQVRVHLERLRQLEYIIARHGRPGSAFQYELLADSKEVSSNHQIGLLDVQKLRVRSKPDGKTANLTEGCRPVARQVKPVENKDYSINLTACPKRTSGPLVAVLS
ncbi:toprim domain-containing protein, partial [Verrucomicrobiota bacterium]